MVWHLTFHSLFSAISCQTLGFEGGTLADDDILKGEEFCPWSNCMTVELSGVKVI